MKIAKQIEYTVYLLIVIGLIFIFNSSIVHSQNVFGTPHRFFVLHLMWSVLGLVSFKVFTKVNLEKLFKLAPMIYGATLFLLAILALWGVLPCSYSTEFAPCINNANRWLVLNLPFLGQVTLQPSELAKLSVVLFLAFKLKKLKDKKDSQNGFLAFILYTGIAAFLILLEPNMSTALLIFFIGTVMFFCSGNSLRQLFTLIPIFIAFSVLMIFTSGYRSQRLTTFLNSDSNGSKIGEGYQVRQVKIALGSGGFFGVGFGQSRQKYTYLPEVATDSIFAVIGEELGFLGSMTIILLFGFLVFKVMEVGRRTEQLDQKLFAVGVAAWIGAQFLIHMMANSGLIPYTGVPLPLISYGGSSLLFSLVALGVLVNISKLKA